MNGVYIAACGTFSIQLIFISIPIGLLVTNIVYTHAIIDFETDQAMNKQTLAVILKAKKWMNILSFLLIFTPFIIILAGVILKFLHAGYLFTFLALFHGIYLFKLILAFQQNKQIELNPHWWMKPMEKWEAIKNIGIDWFMIRWYLARNMLIFFSLLIIIIFFILTFYQ
jgi:1,4-dihydroxy-2-naphthoate octaprenyltransferase